MIHLFRKNNKNFCVDPASGAVHIVDDLAYALLERISPPMGEKCPDELAKTLMARGFDPTDIDETYDELRQLAAARLLFGADECAGFARALQPAPLKSMCLNVAHDCNLRCAYCFAAQGDFGKAKALMPLETAKAAVDFLVAKSGKRRNLEIDFFGGEPLMNWGVVTETVAYARSLEEKNGKKFTFTITTNGLLLDDEKSDYINANMKNVVLSFDGRKDIHDKMRPAPNGGGSYDLVVPRYQKLLAGRGGKEYYVRGTFTRENLDFTEDIKHMVQLGFTRLSIEPAVLDSTLPFALRDEDIPRIVAEYDRLAEFLRDRTDVTFFHFLIDLTQGACVIKRLRGCSCGNEYCAVTPDGDIYPCHQFVGLDEWRMGSVLTGEWDSEKQRELVGGHIYNKPECQKCWARFYCGGGCNAANVQYQHSLFEPTPLMCELERRRVECAIGLQ
ncbi:MAG: thioether cross-link-forming SCIFF peptide maturase [Oscillospiraceae bacterium]|nr:thioether cross-link-forming SCIFF peptide maturase [Oscillospiraceae bacterium]